MCVMQAQFFRAKIAVLHAQTLRASPELIVQTFQLAFRLIQRAAPPGHDLLLFVLHALPLIEHGLQRKNELLHATPISCAIVASYELVSYMPCFRKWRTASIFESE